MASLEDFMADEMKKPEISAEDEQLKIDLPTSDGEIAPEKKRSKGRTAGIVLAWIAGVIVILFFLANAVGYFIKSDLFARMMGALFLDDLFGKMNYVTETDYEVPSSWDPDEGIGASTNLEDLINQMQKEEEEKNKAEQEKAEQEGDEESPGLSE